MPANDGRRPAWSQALTVPLAGRIRPGWRPAALAAIKAVHTAVFASVGAAIALFVLDGARRRPGRRAAIALGETGVYVSNNQVCPLTPLAEELGAASGSVADIFLPGWFSRRIPDVAGSALALGLFLNLRALYRGHPVEP